MKKKCSSHSYWRFAFTLFLGTPLSAPQRHFKQHPFTPQPPGCSHEKVIIPPFDQKAANNGIINDQREWKKNSKSRVLPLFAEPKSNTTVPLCTKPRGFKTQPEMLPPLKLLSDVRWYILYFIFEIKFFPHEERCFRKLSGNPFLFFLFFFFWLRSLFILQWQYHLLW